MDEVLKQLDKPALASKKFRFALLGLILMATISIVSIYWRADATLVGVLLSNILLLVAGYVGSTSWQEKAVRMAAIRGE